MFNVGETVVCSIEVYSDTTLTDPSTSTTITITNSAGTVIVSAVAMTQDSTGKYHYELQTAGFTALGEYIVLYIITNGTRITYRYDSFQLG